MAAARQCAGRGAYDFALKMFDCYHPGRQIISDKLAALASSLSVGFLFDDTKDLCRNKAENGHIRVEHPDSGVFPATKQRVSESYFDCGRKEHFLKLFGGNFLFYQNSGGVFCCSRNRRSTALYFVRNYVTDGTRAEPLYRTKTGYYDLLGVSSSATQAQIKTAYYKQCFLFHPDRNSGSDEATERFSEISEAYTVLGNKALRRKYDQGLLSLSDLTVRRSGTGTPGAAATAPTDRRRPMAGKDIMGSVFDFDQFYRSHYSEQLQRQRDIRVRRDEMLKKKADTLEDKKPGRLLEIGVGMLLVFGIGILYNLRQ